MKKSLILSIVLIFIAIHCFSQTKTKQQHPKNSIKSSIIGIWSNGESENATFEIDKDSIYYLESNKKFSYNIINDSIYISFDGFQGIYKISKPNKNSLILIDNENKQSAYKRFKG